jgi:hypothetical protein
MISILHSNLKYKVIPQYMILLSHRTNFTIYICYKCGSSGSIVSDYGLDDRGSIPDRGRGFFL